MSLYFKNILTCENTSDKPQIDGDGICEMKLVNQACLSSSTSLITDCIERIHMWEDKRSSQCKLMQKKLAIALEHLVSFSKIAFELDCPGEVQELDLELSTVLRHSTECMRTVLNDCNIQVLSHTIGAAEML